jgi:hypothetical protein
MRVGLGILSAVLTAALCSCGSHADMPASSGGRSAAPEAEQVDAGRVEVPGTPTLSGGARIIPSAEAEVPLPKVAAQAGVDFAGNRFIVIFENQPTSNALATYLDGDPPGTGSDAVSARDNAPLVQHAFYRKVSHNVAVWAAAGLVDSILS